MRTAIKTRQNKLRRIFPFDQKNIYYFGYARTALWEGLRLLQISEGDNALLPAYICNVVLAPFNHLGVKVKFYDVDDNLIPDIQQIKGLIDKNTRAILAVNYFGFPQQIKGILEICRNSKIYFIEDNAHGFLSSNQEKSLGSFGDIAIFSFRKTLSIPNGAALVINRRDLASSGLTQSYHGNTSADIRFLITSLKDQLRSWPVLMKIKQKLFTSNNPIYTEESVEEENNLHNYFIKFSKLSALTMRYLDYKKIIDSRRKTYQYLLEYFIDSKGVELIYKKLDKGIVPYVFPVRVKDREKFVVDIYAKGISSFPWPTLPREVISADGERLPGYQDIVCLPVSKGIRR